MGSTPLIGPPRPPRARNRCAGSPHFEDEPREHRTGIADPARAPRSHSRDARDVRADLDGADRALPADGLRGSSGIPSVARSTPATHDVCRRAAHAGRDRDGVGAPRVESTRETCVASLDRNRAGSRRVDLDGRVAGTDASSAREWLGRACAPLPRALELGSNERVDGARGRGSRSHGLNLHCLNHDCLNHAKRSRSFRIPEHDGQT